MLVSIIEYFGYVPKSKILERMREYNRDLVTTQNYLRLGEFDEDDKTDRETVIQMRYKVKMLNVYINDLRKLIHE
jgi:hypothetical protein